MSKGKDFAIFQGKFDYVKEALFGFFGYKIDIFHILVSLLSGFFGAVVLVTRSIVTSYLLYTHLYPFISSNHRRCYIIEGVLKNFAIKLQA